MKYWPLKKDYGKSMAKHDRALIDDVSHWQNLKPPLAPSEYEVAIFREQIAGVQPVYLLGMTKELLPLCDMAIDLNPIEIEKPVIRSDWNDIVDIKAGVIIGDGVINLVGMQLVEKILPQCHRLVCRVFMKKFAGMKYATHFPNHFPGASRVIATQQDIVIVVWDR